MVFSEENLFLAVKFLAKAQSCCSATRSRTADKDGSVVEKVAKTQLRPHTPDLVIYKILQLLPTKSSVRTSFISKQWNGVWSMSPVLDLDEGKIDFDDHQSRNFIPIWERYMDQYRQKDKKLLEKFRLRMRYFVGDATMLYKWLQFAIKRGVKELDISLPSDDEYFNLPLYTIVNTNGAIFISSLHLECVSTEWKPPFCDISLPNLKTMSLKNVRFDSFEDFLWFIEQSPSIEYLTLTSCDILDWSGSVSSANLKSLEIIQCNWGSVCVRAVNLQSFTLVSASITECPTVAIESKHLRHLVLRGIRDDVKAEITTPELLIVSFSGPLMPNSNLWDATLTLPGLSDFDCSLQHFSSLRDYLEKFDCCKQVSISVLRAQDIIFPEAFRQIMSPPMPNIEYLELIFRSPKELGKFCDVEDSLHWMAPATVETPKITRYRIWA